MGEEKWVAWGIHTVKERIGDYLVRLHCRADGREEGSQEISTLLG